jgi:hypothetical protein
MILIVRSSENKPIESPIIAKILAFDEKLFLDLGFRYRRTNCRYRFIPILFPISLLGKILHL